MFYLYGDVTITIEGLQILTYIRHPLAIEHWGFFSLQHLLERDVFVHNGHLLEPPTLAPAAI